MRIGSENVSHFTALSGSDGRQTAGFPDLKIFRFFQAFNEGIDLGRLDPFKVITDTHVKNKSIYGTEVEFSSHGLAQPPGLDIFFHGLRYGKLGRPFNIVTLVFGQDTWLGNRQIFTVDLLYGLQFEESASGKVCRSNILSQLGIGAGGRSEGNFQR